MFKLYYAPDNASLVLRLVLEEAALPYEAILVDREVKEQKTPEYLALNPTGLIPTLITPQGVLTETGACLLWFADTYPNAHFGPTKDDTKRGVFLRWLFYLSNTVHADLIRIFYPHRYVPKETIDIHHNMIAGLLQNHFDILDAAIRDQPSIFTPSSALTLYIGPLVRWAALYPVSNKRWLDLSKYPSLEELVVLLEERPSVRTAAAAEGLGNTPFSRPQLPNPPEGSAT